MNILNKYWNFIQAIGDINWHWQGHIKVSNDVLQKIKISPVFLISSVSEPEFSAQRQPRNDYSQMHAPV